MPFDVMTETPAIRKAVLIDALRAEMPARFTWDFEDVRTKTDCGTVGCAMGLAGLLWPDYDGSGEWFGLSSEATRNVFGVLSMPGGFDKFYGCLKRDVTPGMVADALEKIASETKPAG